ncbi:MAG: SPOR domain-containing protein [Acetobacterales bacterium]
MADEDLDIPRNERTALSRTPNRRRLLPVVLLVLLLVAGGLVGWQYFAAFTQQSAQQEIPIVRAEPGPVKVRPEEPGGMRIPNQDKLVYGRLGETGEPRVERLMPPAEQPMTPPQPAPVPAAAPDSGENGSSVPVPPAGPAADGRQPPMTETAPGAQPRRETPPMSSSGQVAARMTLPTDTAARRQDMAQAETVPPPPPPPPAEGTGSSRPAAPRVEQEPAPAHEPEPAPAPRQEAAPSRPAAAPAASGDWMLQLGALRSEAAARTEWSRLQKSHQDLLGAMTLDIQRAEVPGKGTFYRIRTGPVADRDAGNAVCGKLALRKIGCFVVKR